jgi:ubiquinone/menaquinone biosynthesis C-methylase UbiE
MTSRDPNAKARRVWDKAAVTYDDSMGFFERTFIEDGREWITSRARGRVLEVAVGTGRDLPYYSADVTLTGIDLSPAMLRIARRRAAELGLEVDLRVGDAQKLPFDDESFDTVVTALALCSIPDAVMAITEMKRVLVPGGRLLLLDHIRSSWPPIAAGQWLVERVTIPAAGDHLTRRHLPVVKRSGLEIVETVRRKAGTIERIHAQKPVEGAAP